jgi:hypothetical protein
MALIQSVYNLRALVIMGDVSEELAIVLANVPLCGARELYGVCEKVIEYGLKLRRG